MGDTAKNREEDEDELAGSLSQSKDGEWWTLIGAIRPFVIDGFRSPKLA